MEDPPDLEGFPECELFITDHRFVFATLKLHVVKRIQRCIHTFQHLHGLGSTQSCGSVIVKFLLKTDFTVPSFDKDEVILESVDVLVMAVEVLHKEAKPLGLKVSWSKNKVQMFGGLKVFCSKNKVQMFGVLLCETVQSPRSEGCEFNP